MMNDVKALSDAPPSAGLIEFLGAYHASEDGQVLQNFLQLKIVGSRPSAGLRVPHVPLLHTQPLSTPQRRGRCARQLGLHADTGQLQGSGCHT